MLTVLPHRDELGVKHGRLLIDGMWVDGAAGETWTHVHPATNEDVASFAVAAPHDVEQAVEAARRAFDDGAWTGLSVRDRERIMRRVASLISEHGDELDRLQTLDNGMPVSFSSIYQVSSQMTADIFDFHAGGIGRIAGDTLPTHTGDDMFIMTIREPVGVVGAVIPWNAPLMLFAQKVAPALAAGCTLVLKPSEFASLAVIRLAELLEEAGVPAGVFNLVLGPGDPVGATLIGHPQVDKLTFTGSRAVGKRILHAAAENIARVSLELGGKSANIVFPDVADLDSTALGAMGMVSMGLAGQGCVCHTRLLAHRDVYDELVERCEFWAGVAVLGDPFDPGTTTGPIISPRHAEQVVSFVERGRDEGARLVCGGDRPGGDLAAGNFVNPTLFADVDNAMTIAQEEIFGPVLAVVPFADEAEAVRLANDSSYGLGASVHTTDINRAVRVTRSVRSGTFGINGYTVMPNAPFGGYKQSGLGREGGGQGLDAFLETKTVTLAVAPPAEAS